MKKFSLVFALLSIIVFLNACKKNSVDEQYTEIVQPVIPDLTTQVNAVVAGFITDEQGNALEAASIKAGTTTVLTDDYGYFRITNVSFAKSAGFIQVNKPGYFDGYRTFLPLAGKESFVRLQMIPKVSVGIINAITGGTVSTADGAVITLPGNAVVVASNNTVYSGNVSVSAHWLNPANQIITQQTMPGDLRGIDRTGYLKALVTYGMIAVELTGSSGELLQIAAGKKASISFPIPSSLQSTAPVDIPLWYFDETNGLWKEEGKAVKNGNKYVGEVSHFSFWNCDVPMPLVNFSVQLVDTDFHPLSHIAVSIAIAGMPNSVRTGYTDANGHITGMVPANMTLLMKIQTVCNADVSNQTFQTTNSPLDLGTLKINLAQYGTVFKGTVNNCNGLPVTNGYVIIIDQGIHNVAEIVNGVFNSTGMICASGNQGEIRAVDRATSMMSPIQNVILNTGVNDFGTIQACTIVAGENITYLLDGVTTVLNLPQQLFTVNYSFSNSITTVRSWDLLNSITRFSIDINGMDTPGTHLLNLNQLQLDQAYVFMTPNSLSISDYGLVGQFINGSYSGTIRRVSDNSIHTLSFTFHLIRDM